jgi:hypothetical protein
VRDRVLLGLAVMLLFVGLTVWTVTSRDADIDAERRAYLQALRDPPPLGTDLHPADPRGAAAADAFRRAGQGDAPLRVLFERDHAAVIGVGVAARDAMRVWTALHDVAHETHLAPVILGDGFALAAHADAAAHTSTSVDAVLRRASALDLDAWLAARPVPTAGTPTPVAPRPEAWQSVLDPVLRAPIFDVAIALLPTDHASDAPAWLAFGNWRDCPEPAVHVAILRELETLAHADVVAITADRVELRVATPPTGPSDRNRLAELLARWDPSAFAEDRATIASWSSTFVTSPSWSLSFPHPR